VIRDTRAAARPAEYESVVTIGQEDMRGSVTSLSSAVLYIKSEFHSVNSPSHPTSMAASSLADFVTHSPEVRQAPAPALESQPLHTIPTRLRDRQIVAVETSSLRTVVSEAELM